MKHTVIGFFLSVAVMFSASPAFASFAIAANGTASLTISKTVLDPQKYTYTHSLSLSDSMYHPGDTVTFHITVSNTGNTPISEVLVKDTFPSFVTFVNGTGNFDKPSNTLSFVAQNLAGHTTQTFAVSGKVVDASHLPTNQGIVCTANKVSAKGINTAVVNDTASFCIQKSGSNSQLQQPEQVTSTPSTGPETLPLVGLIGSGLTGMLLRKRTGK
ncbi:MAG: DUF11 domain-containing protein [Patescibacteria group bacterium]|nr:DUF11 domain-containing protein [Patescibacteria group bacterium]MDE2588444.1 DUF11 domain-containing protein [Patescibacteria group bacterium]